MIIHCISLYTSETHCMKFSPFWPNGFSSCCSQNVFSDVYPAICPLSRRNWGVFVYLLMGICRVQVLYMARAVGSQHWWTASLYIDDLQTAGTGSPLAWVSPWAAVLLTDTDFPVYRARLLHLLNEHSCRSDVTLHIELQWISVSTHQPEHAANQRTATHIVIYSDNQYYSVFVYV